MAAALAAVALAAGAGAGLGACSSDDTGADASARLGAEGGAAPARPANAVAQDVVDGDTIDVSVDGRAERVRLLGIDTPETVDPDGPVECFGAEATRRLVELVPPGTPVQLVLDTEPRDAYDRLLAYVFRADDGLFVNLALVGDGYADVLIYEPNVAYADALSAAAADARAAGLGLWGACGGADLPLEPG